MKTPLSPKELLDHKLSTIPPEVYEAFNELMAKRLNDGETHVKQCDVIALILQKLPQLKRNELFDNGWLDVEPHYRKVGWTVVYDKPAYCETYEPNWTFKAKRRK